MVIIGTGNTPLHHVYHQRSRFIFFDAPLRHLDAKVAIPLTDAGPAATFHWDKTLSPMASDKYPIEYHVAMGLPPWNPIMTQLRAYCAEATRRGMTSRWWGGAHDPRWVRRRVWEIHVAGGATWINADDLRDATEWSEGR